MLYAVILAGGSGTRLWPRSRVDLPKQFLNLLDERTMLQEAVARVAPLVQIEQVFVITNREYLGLVQEQVPGLPRDNIILEISSKGTAPAIGLAAITLRRRDPGGVMAVLTADHVIHDCEQLRRALSCASRVTDEGYLVTLGIKASYPETGFGYIECGQLLRRSDDFRIHRVARFTEKPDLRTAQDFVDSGRYVWNSGMFIWRIDAILGEMERQMPALYHQLEYIASALGSPYQEERLSEVWPQITKQTIDFGVMEHARQVAVIPVEIGWSDIGSWAALLDLLPAGDNGNVLRGRHALIDTRGSLIDSPCRLVAAIGLEDMIVVDTPDVVLICPKSRAQDVRQIVDMLQRWGLDKYLTHRRSCAP